MTLARAFIVSALVLAATSAVRAEDVATFALTLKDHAFTPSEVKVPAGKPFKLTLHNADPTPAEFESKALKFEKDGKRYLYHPAVSRASCVRDESRSFARRIFGGEIGAVLAHFVSDSRLSKKQIEELRRLLDEKER